MCTAAEVAAVQAAATAAAADVRCAILLREHKVELVVVDAQDRSTLSRSSGWCG
jgi:hypothetical protein